MCECAWWLRSSAENSLLSFTIATPRHTAPLVAAAMDPPPTNPDATAIEEDRTRPPTPIAAEAGAVPTGAGAEASSSQSLPQNCGVAPIDVADLAIAMRLMAEETNPAFASRPISSARHTATCPFRHISAQLQQFQECACQGPAIRLKTQREAEQARIQKELDSIVPPVGCPIAQQPVTLLALICRCLNARDLVSTFKTCRQLCNAAQHPLTFQHGVSYLVDTSADSSGACKGVRSFGPHAVCATLRELQTAMASRLFKSFRILTLQNDSPRAMAEMMRELAQPAAPHLHSLQLLCSSIDMDSIADVPVLGAIPSLQYLKTLSVHLPPNLEGALVALPPRLEVLQMVFSLRYAKKKKKGGGLAPTEYLLDTITESLRPLQHLRHLICKPHELQQKSQGGRAQRIQCSQRTTLGDLRRLEEISKMVPQLDTIGWFIPMDPATLITEMREAFQADPASAPPSVRKMTQLRLTTLQYDSGCTPCDVLTCFPQLTEVRFAKSEILSFATSPGLYPRWNPALARGLIELRVDAMALAGSHANDVFHRAGDELRASMFIKGSNLIPSTNAILVAQLTGAQLSGLQKLSIVGAETRDASTLVREWERLMRGGDKLDRMIQKPAVPMPVDLGLMLQTMPQLRFLSLSQFELADFSPFKYAPNLATLKGVSWPAAVRAVPDDPRDLISCFPSLTALSVVSSPSLDDRTAFHYRHVLELFPALRAVTWKREKAIHPTKIEAHYKESEVARAQALIKREQLEREAAERSKEAHETAMAMHKAGLAPLTEEQSWYRGDINKKGTAKDMELVSTKLRLEWEAAKRAEPAVAAVMATPAAGAAAGAGAGFPHSAFSMGSMDSLQSQFSMANFDSTAAGPSGAFEAAVPAAFSAAPASKSAAGKKSRTSGGGGARHSTTPAKSAAAASFSTPPQGAGGFGSFQFTSPSSTAAEPANALLAFSAASPAPFGVSSAPFAAFATPPAGAAPVPAPASGFNFSSPAPAPAFAFNSPAFVFNAPAAANAAPTDSNATIPPPTFKF